MTYGNKIISRHFVSNRHATKNVILCTLTNTRPSLTHKQHIPCCFLQSSFWVSTSLFVTTNKIWNQVWRWESGSSLWKGCLINRRFANRLSILQSFLLRVLVKAAPSITNYSLIFFFNGFTRLRTANTTKEVYCLDIVNLFLFFIVSQEIEEKKRKKKYKIDIFAQQHEYFWNLSIIKFQIFTNKSKNVLTAPHLRSL